MSEQEPRRYYYSPARKERQEQAQLEKESQAELRPLKIPHNPLNADGHFDSLQSLTHSTSGLMKLYKNYVVDCILRMEQQKMDIREFYRLKRKEGYKRVRAIEIYMNLIKEPKPSPEKNKPNTW